jgi:hypothetical protein
VLTPPAYRRRSLRRASGKFRFGTAQHNEKDLIDIPKEIREKMSFVFVEDIQEAISAALAGEGGRQRVAVQEPPQALRI